MLSNGAQPARNELRKAAGSYVRRKALCFRSSAGMRVPEEILLTASSAKYTSPTPPTRYHRVFIELMVLNAKPEAAHAASESHGGPEHA